MSVCARAPAALPPSFGTLVATLFSEDDVCAALTAAGYRVEALVTREPYPFEYPSRRIYATAART